MGKEIEEGILLSYGFYVTVGNKNTNRWQTHLNSLQKGNKIAPSD